MEYCTITDIETHNKISAEKIRDLPDDAKTGELLFVMYPGLLRCGMDGYKDVQIEKAVIVVRCQKTQPSIAVEINKNRRVKRECCA